MDHEMDHHLRWRMSGTKLKIAFVTTIASEIGGAHIHVRDLSSALTRDGHDVRVFAGGDGPFFDQLRDRGVAITSITTMRRSLSPFKDLAARRELMAALREFNPEVISSHSSKAGILARSIGRRLGIPTLFTAHGWAFTDGVPSLQRFMYVMAERRAGRISQKAICVSEVDRQIAIQHHVMPAERLITIHNGMPDHPGRADSGHQPPRIVSVARMAAQKDHPTLLRALAKLKDQEWYLDLVGSGPREAEIVALAQELGIYDRITLHGSLSDVTPVLINAQIFALVSNYEGFPRSTLEAMRAALPVIVSDVGGSREALIEGVTGYSVPRADADILAARLGELISNPDLRVKMGIAGRERYEALFTFDRMRAATEAVYAQLLGENR